MTDDKGRDLRLSGTDWLRIVLFLITPILGTGGWMVRGQYENSAKLERLEDGQHSAEQLSKSQFEEIGRRIKRIEDKEDRVP